ncbi:TPA: glycosyltransferase family 4 protein [Vibrio parahaemolyticus]|nr:glycosyltransferase family 4 protein [Vibrio parahaemolyticus]HCG7779032.1 glycosyltransferase family 4 protein [Vibrio parahaemolyticus]HCH4902127.1 glycosyltransferase family 4 protein [Vibrio parahaemolyticus]
MIYIYSTNPESITGGIAKTVSTLVASLKNKKIEHKVISTHIDTNNIFEKIKLILFSMKSAFLTNHNDVVYLNAGGKISIFRKSIIALIAKCKGAKVLLHIHGPSLTDNLDSRYYRCFFKIMCKSIDQLVVLTPWWVEQLSCYHNKITILPNSVDLDVAAVPRAKSEGERLLFLSRLEKEKGADIAIMSLLFNSCKLTIAGEGQDKERLIGLVKKHKLEDRVVFYGWANESDKITLLENHDVFLLPSRGDSFGMGYIEAMSYGLPCVGLNYKSLIDVITDDVGLIVDINDKEDIDIAKEVGRSCQCLVNDNILYYKLSKGAIEKVRKVYSSDIVVKKFIDYLY